MFAARETAVLQIKDNYGVTVKNGLVVCVSSTLSIVGWVIVYGQTVSICNQSTGHQLNLKLKQHDAWHLAPAYSV